MGAHERNQKEIMNVFEKKIVEMVREKLSDTEILGLVRYKLAHTHAIAVDAAPETLESLGMEESIQPRKAKSRTTNGAKRPRERRTEKQRELLLDAVEKAVWAGDGMSASQVAAKVKAPQPRVAAALRELKANDRIQQGGERRFARYAATKKQAVQASLRDRREGVRKAA